jgi:hypothetical protein
MWRNAPFALLPFGIWLLCVTGASVSSNVDSEAAVGVFATIGILALIATVSDRARGGHLAAGGAHAQEGLSSVFPGLSS